MKKSLSLLTVLGNDRPGIIAAVTGALYREGCNLEDISMTVLEGEFAMIMVVCLKKESKERLKKIFGKLKGRQKLDFFWKDLGKNAARREKTAKNSKTFLISAIGQDRTGIVFRVSRLLADAGINITDLNSKILGKGPKTLYAMVLEASIPDRVKISRLERALRQTAKILKIEITIKPFERIEF